MSTDLVPLLRKSIERLQARKQLRSARFNLQLARLELAKAVREVQKTMRTPLHEDLSDIAVISDERRNSK